MTECRLQFIKWEIPPNVPLRGARWLFFVLLLSVCWYYNVLLHVANTVYLIIQHVRRASQFSRIFVKLSIVNRTSSSSRENWTKGAYQRRDDFHFRYHSRRIMYVYTDRLRRVRSNYNNFFFFFASLSRINYLITSGFIVRPWRRTKYFH